MFSSVDDKHVLAQSVKHLLDLDKDSSVCGSSIMP